MKYSYKIFLSILIILGLGFWGYGYWLMKEIRGQYSESIEESLVDFSNILAAYLSAQAEGGQVKTDDFNEAFKNFKKSSFRANIHGVIKGDSPINAYVTDEKGKVLFDSRDPTNVGKDFSQWNDVYLTLKGQYGARSTRSNDNDPLSSVFYVAAPIQYEDRIIGVVSVIKPEKSLQVFVARGRQKIIFTTFLILIGATIIAAIFSYWLTRPINALTRYAQKISEGESARPPRSTSTEFNNLAKAFDEMRISLEGKKSVENFVQHLTHELKSPLSAIMGAAELLKEDMPPEKREKFLNNIEIESTRAKSQLEDLLTLATLESRSELIQFEKFSLSDLLEELKMSYLPLLENKGLELKIKVVPQDLLARGERKLIAQAISSILSNAIDFSPQNGVIEMNGRRADRNICIEISDQGPGIPEYAQDRIFEKFYSLERPDTGKKSTGLGLSFVKEAISLHSGEIKILSSNSKQESSNGSSSVEFESSGVSSSWDSGAKVLITLKN